MQSYKALIIWECFRLFTPNLIRNCLMIWGAARQVPSAKYHLLRGESEQPALYTGSRHHEACLLCQCDCGLPEPSCQLLLHSLPR